MVGLPEGIGSNSNRPDAVDDVDVTREDTAITVDLLANDSDPNGDPLTVISASVPPHTGTLVDNGDGTVTFTPAQDYNGVAVITYTIEDTEGLRDTATHKIAVMPENDAPIAVDDSDQTPFETPIVVDLLANDSDPDGDALTVVSLSVPPEQGSLVDNGDGTATFTPAPGFTGTATISYTIEDEGGLQDSAVHTVLVQNTGAPDAVDDAANTLTDTPVVIDALANDTDPENGLLTIIDVSVAPEFGTAQIVNNQVVFTPAPGFEGQVTLDYTIEDEDGLTDDAVITVNVRNGIVNGTPGGDLIDAGYVGDPGGDLVDSADAVLPGEEPNDDIILAGDGDDTVLAGDGDDDIFGDAGNDDLSGGDGSDLIVGGVGDDTLTGGDQSDTLDGGDGNDLLNGGPGDDVLSGGADRDTIEGVGPGDTVDGGAGGDDFDVLDLRGSAPDGGSFDVTITGPDSNGNGVDGTVTYFDKDGVETGTLEFTEIEQIVPCFTPGTLIATPTGEKPVESLQVGDRVITRDNGIQEIRWIGQRGMTAAELKRAPHLRPVLIRQGALGRGLPERDMLVSPQHRLLVSNDKTMLFFEEREVLVAAKHLTGNPGIDTVDVSWTTYIHLMFDHHEVILSDGAWSESFQPGDQTLGALGNSQRAEILELFPELQDQDADERYPSARRSLKKHEADLLSS